MKAILKFNIFIILSFFPLLLVAGNSCLDENVYTYNSVECCLSAILTKKICEAKIDSLEPEVLEVIKLAKLNILNGNHKKLSAPNCFWFSLGYKQTEYRDQIEIVNEASFLKAIAKDYNFKSVDDVSVGDILYYEGEYEFTHDVVNDGVPVRLTIPFHSGVYMGDDLILQKENSTDSIFSLVPVEDSFNGYSGAIKEMNGGTLNMKVLGINKDSKLK